MQMVLMAVSALRYPLGLVLVTSWRLDDEVVTSAPRRQSVHGPDGNERREWEGCRRGYRKSRMIKVGKVSRSQVADQVSKPRTPAWVYTHCFKAVS